MHVRTSATISTLNIETKSQLKANLSRRISSYHPVFAEATLYGRCLFLTFIFCREDHHQVSQRQRRTRAFFSFKSKRSNDEFSVFLLLLPF